MYSVNPCRFGLTCGPRNQKQERKGKEKRKERQRYRKWVGSAFLGKKRAY